MAIFRSIPSFHAFFSLAWMVSEGWALAYREYGSDYAPHEESAKRARLGLWAGEFELPWEW